MPTKFALAEENAFSRNELRRFLVGKYVALYTIDEAYGVVRVVGFRHGARLPRQADLPDNPTA